MTISPLAIASDGFISSSVEATVYITAEYSGSVELEEIYGAVDTISVAGVVETEEPVSGSVVLESEVSGEVGIEEVSGDV